MATAATRKTLRSAERMWIEAMTDDELEAVIASYPPDPEFCAAIEKLSETELEMAIDDIIDREQIMSIAAGRTSAP